MTNEELEQLKAQLKAELLAELEPKPAKKPTKSYDLTREEVIEAYRVFSIPNAEYTDRQAQIIYSTACSSGGVIQSHHTKMKSLGLEHEHLTTKEWPPLDVEFQGSGRETFDKFLETGKVHGLEKETTAKKVVVTNAKVSSYLPYLKALKAVYNNNYTKEDRELVLRVVNVDGIPCTNKNTFPDGLQFASNTRDFLPKELKSLCFARQLGFKLYLTLEEVEEAYTNPTTKRHHQIMLCTGRLVEGKWVAQRDPSFRMCGEYTPLSSHVIPEADSEKHLTAKECWEEFLLFKENRVIKPLGKKRKKF